MKLASVRHGNVDQVAVALPDESGIALLSDLYDKAGLGAAPTSMVQLLELGLEPGEAGRDDLERAASHIDEVGPIALDEVTWLPPIPRPAKFLGVAVNNTRLNSTAHIPPAGPMFFLKPSSALIGHKGAIVIKDDYGFTFPELELGVVIGRRCKDVAQEAALSYVAGYTIVDDVTSQGLKSGDSMASEITEEQRRSAGYESYFTWRHVTGPDDRTIYFTYHARSKGADTFGPVGPWLVTRDEIPDPDNLGVRGYADGELFAEDSTASYSFPIAKVVAWASRYFTLEPGDIISCGTAAKGVPGYPRAHHEIDMSKATPVVDIEIDGLGRLSNSVVHVAHV